MAGSGEGRQATGLQLAVQTLGARRVSWAAGGRESRRDGEPSRGVQTRNRSAGEAEARSLVVVVEADRRKIVWGSWPWGRRLAANLLGVSC